jgi:AcrR family transcriptional regulator
MTPTGRNSNFLPVRKLAPMTRGPKAQRGEVADRILDQARESFAENGYAATTLQGIARAAGVDTKLVRYYFTNKDALLAECLTVPPEFLPGVRALSAVPPDEHGEALVRHQLSVWADPRMARIMRTSLLIAAHVPAAMARVRVVFVEGLIPAVGGGIDPAELGVRGGLVAAQMLGLAFARFIFAIDQTAAIPDDQIVTQVGATIQRYLDGPL